MRKKFHDRQKTRLRGHPDHAKELQQGAEAKKEKIDRPYQKGGNSKKDLSINFFLCIHRKSSSHEERMMVRERGEKKTRGCFIL